MKTSGHPESEREPAGTGALVHPAAGAGCGGLLWHRLWTTPLSDLLRGRMSCRLDVRAIVGAGDLPEAVGERILETVKRTRLSRREKAGIAGELVAHFADGLEAGVAADELLAGFGDVRASAKLMRRAKLRCRAWPRRAMRRTGQGLGVLVLVYAAATIYYATGRPKVAVDYLARMNAPVLAVPEEERAWPVYREALLALDRERAGELLAMEGLEPGGAGWGEAVAFLGDNRAALATARRAAAMRHLGFVLGTEIRDEDRELWPEMYQGPDNAVFADPLFRDAPETFLLAVRIPYVKDMQQLQRLFAIDATLAAEQGDGERTAVNIEAQLGIARQLRSQNTVLDHLIATSCVIRVIEMSAGALRRRPELLTDGHLRRLAHAIAAEDAMPDIRLDGERLWFDDILQRIYTDDGHGDGHLVPGALRAAEMSEIGFYDRPKRPVAEIAMTPLANGIVASRKEMMACYDRIMDRYQARFATPYWAARQSAEVGDEFRSSMSFLETFRYLFVATSAPAYDRVYRTQEDAVGRRDGILVALALEAHRRRHGDWPATLDELVPDLLPGVPRDRFTGEPLRYRVDGGEVLVYSVGQDLDDDGGVLPEPLETQEPDQSPGERFRTRNKWAGVSSFETPDGDWILWHSAPIRDILEGRRGNTGRPSR